MNNLLSNATYKPIHFRNKYVHQDSLYYYDIYSLEFCSSTESNLQQARFLNDQTYIYGLKFNSIIKSDIVSFDFYK